MARLSLTYITSNAMNNLPLSRLEVIFLRSLLALRAMDFFPLLNYHDCFKNQIVQI